MLQSQYILYIFGAILHQAYVVESVTHCNGPLLKILVPYDRCEKAVASCPQGQQVYDRDMGAGEIVKGIYRCWAIVLSSCLSC